MATAIANTPRATARADTTMSAAAAAPEEHARTPLLDRWVLYAHLPRDTSWKLTSYRRVYGFNSLEDGVAITKALHEVIIKNCMLFLMRAHVEPRWEDVNNKEGGCFSFKVLNRQVVQAWRNLFYCAIGESIFTPAAEALNRKVTGITISPKKSFCIVKVWLSDCKTQTVAALSEIPGLSADGCLFKRHMPTPP